MTPSCPKVWLFAIAVALSSSLLAVRKEHPPATRAELRHAFEHPPEDCKIMVRWWWFGPAVTAGEIERELRAMKQAGIGGVEVQAVYPLALDDPQRGIKNLSFLSPEFLQALKFAREKADELGLRFDLTLGSGWPYGGPEIPVTQGAPKLRIQILAAPAAGDQIRLPYIGEGEDLLDIFVAPGTAKNFSVSAARELLPVNGRYTAQQKGSGPHVLLIFTASRTGQTVKRAANGAEGFVLDHYSQEALDTYLRHTGEELLSRLTKPPRAIFCDSLEVYGSDWASDFLEQFRLRRHYELKPLLPALVDRSDDERSAAIRHDWGLTLTELFNERFAAPLTAWAHQHGTLLRAQLYGTPPATLSSYSLIDLQEGERAGSRWNEFSPTRWASSAGHLYGRNVTSSETWTWLHSPAFRATPLDMKAEADLHFLMGINQLVGHGWPYSPASAGEPGWRFYAAVALNEHNPWWLVMPDLAMYLQRASFLMRQGQPVTDVAVYLPGDDAYARFSPGNTSLSETIAALVDPQVVQQILDAGYNFDFIDDAALRRAEASDGMLRINGNRYRALVLPGAKRISTETLHQMDVFARGGGALIAIDRAPSEAPGLLDSQSQTTEIRTLSRSLFEANGAPGRVIAARALGSVLRSIMPADAEFSPASPQIGFVHRKAPVEDIYFVANTANQPASVTASFQVARKHAEQWNPLTGRTLPLEAESSNDRTAVHLDLAPYGSTVVVLSDRGSAPSDFQRGACRTPAEMDQSNDWEVSFGHASQPPHFTRLHSWTEDEPTHFFSGQATYEKQITVPGAFLTTGCSARLHFGPSTPLPVEASKTPGMQAWLGAPVRDAALVYVNDQRAGTVWAPPYSIEVTGLLHIGINRLRIVVGNTAMNEMAGEPLPDYRLLYSRYGKRFEPQDMDKVTPLPSGLLGPVRLISGP